MFFLKSAKFSNTGQQSKIKLKINVSSPPYVSLIAISFMNGVMVIAAGNGHGDTSSNPGRD